jgi:hypothetical protein
MNSDVSDQIRLSFADASGEDFAGGEVPGCQATAGKASIMVAMRLRVAISSLGALARWDGIREPKTHRFTVVKRVTARCRDGSLRFLSIRPRLTSSGERYKSRRDEMQRFLGGPLSFHERRQDQ